MDCITTTPPVSIINFARPDSFNIQMDARILKLLRRAREIEALQEELTREAREISRELTQRRDDELNNKIAEALK